MAFFISGFKVNAIFFSNCVRTFEEVVPSSMVSSIYEMHGQKAHIAYYSGGKVIPDISITDEKGSSWLVLLGTPLIGFRSEQEQRAFIADFFTDPTRTILTKVDGNFAVISYDAMSDRLILASDFNNSTPIFYSNTPKGLLLSSHELALARILKHDIDPQGFFQSVNLGVTWGEYSRFKNISKTLPCEIIMIDHNQQLTKEQYWKPQDESQWTGSFDELIDSWLEDLEESISSFFDFSGRKDIIVDFTAGEDSRLVLSQCHALGIPFRAHVAGDSLDTDVVIAKKASAKTGIDLIVRERHWITSKELLDNALNIDLLGDAYKEFTFSCRDFALATKSPLDDYGNVKLCGLPGGEAFRGSYYLRGKAIFPSKMQGLDYKFFVGMKYLLDYHPEILRPLEDGGIELIYEMVRESLRSVNDFPVGIHIDHLLRLFQTSLLGLKYKNPLYLPFATRKMTQSIYSIPPRYKRGGKLTKACTERLYPELARCRTQNGVPTLRKTLIRQPLFLPEYLSQVKGISIGALSRLFKFTKANKWYYNQDKNLYIFVTLLNKHPFSEWFSSAATMNTGFLYNPGILNPILAQAKAGSCRLLPLLGRVINQELANRWVYR